MATYSSREMMMRARLLEVLTNMSLQFPSISVDIDLWRPKVISPGEFADEGKEEWIRLSESVPAFCIDTTSRWFDVAVGIVEQNANFVVLPVDPGLHVDDHIIINGVPWMIISIQNVAGVCKAKIDRLKSRFVAPARSTPTFRELGIKARIA